MLTKITLSRFIYALCLMGGLLSCLTGCQSTSPLGYGPAQPPSQISLAVSRLEITQDPQVSGASADAVNPPFGAQVESWLSARFLATGVAPEGAGDGAGHFIIRKAALQETALPKESGVSALFKKQLSEQYDALLEVVFEIRDDVGFAQKMVNAQVHRTTAVLEGVSLQEREATIQKLINQTLMDCEQELTKNMQQFMPFVVQ